MEEQEQIMRVKAAFDKHISNLEAELTLTIKLKTALMQVLLSGDKRVVLKQPESVAV